MNRRIFLLGAGAGLAAPAIVQAESLMKLWVPPRVVTFDRWRLVETIQAIDAGVWGRSIISTPEHIAWQRQENERLRRLIGLSQWHLSLVKS